MIFSTWSLCFILLGDTCSLLDPSLFKESPFFNLLLIKDSFGSPLEFYIEPEPNIYTSIDYWLSPFCSSLCSEIFYISSRSYLFLLSILPSIPFTGKNFLNLFSGYSFGAKYFSLCEINSYSELIGEQPKYLWTLPGFESDLSLLLSGVASYCLKLNLFTNLAFCESSEYFSELYDSNFSSL